MPKIKPIGIENPTEGQILNVAEGSELYTGDKPKYETYNPNIINSTSLEPSGEINLPDEPQDNNNYQGIINSSDAIFKNQTNLFKDYMEAQQAPPDLTDLYKTLGEDFGITEKETELTETQKKQTAAQKQLDLINAELQGLIAESKAVPIQIQEEFAGRGVTKGGVQPIETGRLRQIALRALPLQTQAFAAQAEVFAAQGNTAAAEQALNMAQTRMDRIFKIQSTNITNQYNYQQSQLEAVYNFASGQQQQQLDVLMQQSQQEFTLMRDKITQAQNLANTALANGQSDIAAKITALDPQSPTYLTDLANLQSQIEIKEDVNNTETEAEAPVTKTLGRDLYQWNPQTGQWDMAIEGRYAPTGERGTPKADPVDETGEEVSEFDFARQIIEANPNATPEELKAGLLENTELNVSEINALIAAKPQTPAPELFSEDWFKSRIQLARSEEFSDSEIVDYIIKNFDIDELFKTAKAAGYAKWYSGKEADIKRYIESLL